MKMGLFLTPGAARAAYQVGAVQALVNEGGLKFDVIAASSVGALNGAFAAMGEMNKLVEIWSNWTTEEVMVMDWGALLKGAILWAPSLMSNQPEHESSIDPFISEEKLLPGIRFRFNLANLSTGEAEVLEYPGAKMLLPMAVGASVAVPVTFPPVEYEGMQLVDGLTLDGFPLEKLLLETGVERVFVIGVAPQSGKEGYCENAYQISLKAMEWNQYSETVLGIRQASEVNNLIRAWNADRIAVEQIIINLISDKGLQTDLLSEVRLIYEKAGFSYTRSEVEIIPILPEKEIEMFFGDFKPERSRLLIEQGRRDAIRVLNELKKSS